MKIKKILEKIGEYCSECFYVLSPLFMNFVLSYVLLQHYKGGIIGAIVLFLIWIICYGAVVYRLIKNGENKS